MRTSKLLSFTLLLGVFMLVVYHKLLGGPRGGPPPRNVTVLLWHWPFGRSYSLRGDVCRDSYNIPRCVLTDKTSLFASADVVVFHHHELQAGRSALPLGLPRRPSQRWVWLSLEPPANNGDLSPYNGLFNWTMSYRRDADIFMPYGKTVRLNNTGSYVIPRKNSCLASWVVSNYKSDHVRSRLYQDLKKSIPIEVYGSWQNKPLAGQDLLATIERCHFYLAFENSIATDYISEKLWRNALQAGAVPVVLGPPKAAYEALAPPGSFIHVDDFISTAELASYLQHLASDRKAYQAFFKWHPTYGIKTYTDWRQRLCNICRKYDELPAITVYHSLEGWARR